MATVNQPLSIRKLVDVYRELALNHPMVNDFQASEMYDFNSPASRSVPVVLFEYPVLGIDVFNTRGGGLRNLKYAFLVLDRIIERPNPTGMPAAQTTEWQEIMIVSKCDMIALSMQQTFINLIANRYDFVINSQNWTTIHRYTSANLFGVRCEVDASVQTPFASCDSEYYDTFPAIESVLNCGLV